ncbi:MAG: carbamoyltransferase HypF [Cyanobium sp.]
MNGEPAGLRLLCRGVVQGVGFRPWVQRLATELELDGVLINGGEGVSVQLSGSRGQLQCFLRRLVAELPAPARLEPLLPHWGPATATRGQGVRIDAGPRQSLGEGWLAPTLAADRAPCADCLAELDDPASRRCGDPFISCARCGPRYSIALARPYRRAHTTLAGFELCEACRREFEDPDDRRFHAETIGCPRCGPRLHFWPGVEREGGEPGSRGDPRALHQADQQVHHQADRDVLHPVGRQAGQAAAPLALACDLLAAGGILALQGVGGFQLLVDATNPDAVARLRRRKRRPARPFALLVADEAALEAVVWIDPAERAALRDGAAPIVLLRRRPAALEAWPGVAPGSPALGVMRPASPLHLLLARRLGRPLVATSGNRSGESLCIDPIEARQRLAGIADAFLVHDRPIARPLDDSVLQVIEGRPVLLRRARGYAPESLPLPAADPTLAAAGPALLALSGDLKCAPALALGDRLWLAPHLGDLADRRCQERFVRGVAELSASLGAPGGSEPRPAAVPLTLICDAHPGYISHQLARSSGLPLLTVQHHLAHGLAVMAEHGLEPPLLVAALDGLGYGESLTAAADGSGAAAATTPHRLWGGELLLIHRERASGPWRAQHLAGLRPFPLPGAERAMAEPRRAALGLLLAVDGLDHPGAWRVRRAFAPADLALLCQAVAAGCQAPLCSSAGRLFDAVASLLGLVQVLAYEGEGGLRLQGAALPSVGGGVQVDGACTGPEGRFDPLPLLAPDGSAEPWRLDWGPMLLRLLDGIAAGVPRELLAARFQRQLAEGLAIALATWADRLALAADQRRVALAGGCFQNRLLLEAVSAGLRRRRLEPWWSQRLPGNDGGLALGQAWAARLGLAINPL